MATPLHLYKVARPDVPDWDEYDSFVAAAATEDEARWMHPNGEDLAIDGLRGTWPVDPASLRVTHLGTADEGIEAGVIVASFNAG